jgi:hypothetical protein
MGENEIVSPQYSTQNANRQAEIRAALEREMDAALAADDLGAWQTAWNALLDSFGAGGAS